MRKAIIRYNNIEAGILTETDDGQYEFIYDDLYIKNHLDLFITFQMPVRKEFYKEQSGTTYTYYVRAVLLDGKVIVKKGEYDIVEVVKGEIYAIENVN